MTLRDVIEKAMDEHKEGRTMFFRPLTFSTCYCLSGYTNKINGVPADWLLDLHVGQHVHRNHGLSVFEATQEWEQCSPPS